MKLGPLLLWTRLAMHILLIFLGGVIIVQGIERKAYPLYIALGIFICLYGIFRLRESLSLMRRGKDGD